MYLHDAFRDAFWDAVDGAPSERYGIGIGIRHFTEAESERVARGSPDVSEELMSDWAGEVFEVKGVKGR